MSEIAFVFPGQGSQKVGMGASVADSSIAREHFDIAEERLGFDLRKICLEGPQEELTLTQNAQPAILTVSVIFYKMFAEQYSVSPKFLAGHSLGEYTALTIGGALDFGDAVHAVHQRGKLMQGATKVGEGAMAAILGKNGEEVSQLCEEESNGDDDYVSPANFNCPGQIVISGHTEAVNRVLKRVKGIPLDVSAPFHSILMKPIEEKLKKVLDDINFRSPSIPVIKNVDAQPISDASEIVDSLIRQISGAVLWEQSVGYMLQNGVGQFLEFGEGRVLGGLLKKIDRSVPCTNINSAESIADYKNKE